MNKVKDTAVKAEGFLHEFRQFIGNKNVLDMAIGVIIAQTFGKIITSLVNDIIMPLLALAMGKHNLEDIVWTLRAADGDEPAVVMNAGVFISVIINFLFIALSLFIVVKVIAALRKRSHFKIVPVPAAPVEPTTEEKTLAALEEIRDLLKEKQD